jgi:hypothetical protein
MRKEGDREGGKRSQKVSDRGDRGLFVIFFCRDLPVHEDIALINFGLLGGNGNKLK